jgi:hypothetical protein
MYLVRMGFLDGVHGLVLSLLGAFTVYLKYARLWEMQILEGNREVPARVEAAGPMVREQIGRMVDEPPRSHAGGPARDAPRTPPDEPRLPARPR